MKTCRAQGKRYTLIATPIFYQVVTNGTNTKANGASQAISITTIGTPITLGHNVLVRLVATSPMFVRFASAGATTATANDIYLPANVPEIFDMGRYNEVIVPFGGAATGTLYYSVVSKA